MQELHREVDPLELASGNGQIAGPRRAGAQHDRVELLEQLCAGDVSADLGAGDEHDPFVGHHLQAALDDPLFELHVRDAVHQAGRRSGRPARRR